MSMQFDLKKIIEQGNIQNELELERALIADRKLRLLAKKDPKLRVVRKKLRDLIEQYENENWAEGSKISNRRIEESNFAERIAEGERQFIQKRKALIRHKLHALSLTQQELGIILGHESKSYMSELMNGISPFTLRDLIIIHRLLRLNLVDLIPTILTLRDRVKVKSSIDKLDNPNLKWDVEDLEVA